MALLRVAESLGRKHTGGKLSSRAFSRCLCGMKRPTCWPSAAANRSVSCHLTDSRRCVLAVSIVRIAFVQCADSSRVVDLTTLKPPYVAPLAPYPRTSHAPTMPRASRRQCDGNQNTIDTSTSWCPPLSRASPHMLWSTLTGNGGIRRAPTRAGAATTCSFFPLTRRMKSTWLQEGTPREPNTPRQHAPLHAYGPVDHISQPQYSAAPTLRVHSIAGSSLVVRGTLSRGLYRAPDQGERRAGVRVKRRDYANRGYGTS